MSFHLNIQVGFSQESLTLYNRDSLTLVPNQMAFPFHADILCCLHNSCVSQRGVQASARHVHWNLMNNTMKVAFLPPSPCW